MRNTPSQASDHLCPICYKVDTEQADGRSENANAISNEMS